MRIAPVGAPTGNIATRLNPGVTVRAVASAAIGDIEIATGHR